MNDTLPSPAAVSVVIVTWNSATTIAECVGPLATDARIELVVVDNDSSDDTLAVVGSAAPTSIRVATAGNCGFAAGVNAGAEFAGGDVLVLLNPDCVADPDTLLALADRVRTDELGLAAPALIDDRGRRTRSTRRLPLVRDQWSVAFGLHRLSSRLDPDDDGGVIDSHRPADVEVVSGACFATPAALFASMGGLDRRFFLYGEEVDYCARLKDANKAVRLFPELEVTHIGGVSADLTPSGTDSILRESRVRWFHKHRGRFAAQAVRVALLTWATIRLPPAFARDLARPVNPRFRRSTGQVRSIRAMARPMRRILTPTHPVAAPSRLD